MGKIQVKIGEWIEKGFNLYKKNFGLLVLASIFTVVISTVTVGILAGPMLAGLALVILELLDKQEPKPEAGKVFKGFDYFINSFLYIVVWGIAVFIGSIILGVVPVIGQLAAIFFVYAAQAFLMFGLFLIVDKKMSFWPASMESINTVKPNFWPLFGLSLVAGIIGSIGAIAFGIGIVFTIPIQGCILAVAYREVFGGAGVASMQDETPGAEDAPPDEPIQPE
jgi:MFS family permease